MLTRIGIVAGFSLLLLVPFFSASSIALAVSGSDGSCEGRLKPGVVEQVLLGARDLEPAPEQKLPFELDESLKLEMNWAGGGKIHSVVVGGIEFNDSGRNLVEFEGTVLFYKRYKLRLSRGGQRWEFRLDYAAPQRAEEQAKAELSLIVRDPDGFGEPEEIALATFSGTSGSGTLQDMVQEPVPPQHSSEFKMGDPEVVPPEHDPKDSVRPANSGEFGAEPRSQGVAAVSQTWFLHELHDETVFEESLSVDENPGLHIQVTPGKPIMIWIGNSLYSDGYDAIDIRVEPANDPSLGSRYVIEHLNTFAPYMYVLEPVAQGGMELYLRSLEEGELVSRLVARFGG